MAADLAGLGNDLQDAALSLCPAIGAVLAAIAAQAGCLLARMSGSGATCFGIFATPAHAAAAAAALPESWWRWGGAPTHDAHETGRR
jgi:4-diphosphocytidyl-2-C-methyl-D-erythritol kinase